MDLEDLRDRLAGRDWQRTEPDPDDPVRFALVGLGWWTLDRTLPAIAAEPGIEATTLVSSSEQKAARVADDRSHHLAGGDASEVRTLDYDAFHDGAATPAHDAVYVGTPNATHLEFAERAATYGKAVLVEKPLEATVERAEALADAVADVPAMTAYRLHAEPSVRAARELLREGAIGDPVAVQGHMTGNVLGVGGPDQWRLDPALAGPGVSVTDIGVYPLNTTRFLLGRDPIAAHASTHSEHDAFAAVPDERASFLLEFERGVTGSYATSQRAQASAALRVIGTDGEVRLDPGTNADPRRELHYRDGDVETSVAFPTPDQMQEEVAFFADHLRDGREFEADAEHGLVDVRAIQAVYDAAERGERVEL